MQQYIHKTYRQAAGNGVGAAEVGLEGTEGVAVGAEDRVLHPECAAPGHSNGQRGQKLRPSWRSERNICCCDASQVHSCACEVNVTERVRMQQAGQTWSTERQQAHFGLLVPMEVRTDSESPNSAVSGRRIRKRMQRQK